VETAIQIVSLVAALFAIALAVIVLWLSLYFYRRNNELYTSLSDMLSRVEASSKVTEVASKDIIKPIVEIVQEMVQDSARGRIDSLRPMIIQRSAAGLDEVLKELPESEKHKVREAVYKEIDSFLGTLGWQLGTGLKETITPTAEAVPSKFVPIPGSALYDWVLFVRRIRDLEAHNKFLSVKMLREKAFAREPETQEALQIAIDREMLLTYYVDNPKNPRFPTLACKLNREHPVARDILQAIGEAVEGGKVSE